MKKAAILCLLLFAGFAHGQEDVVRLVIRGDTEIIEIDRTIITVVKDKRELVKKVPFTIECPPDAFRPQWTVPAGVTYAAKGRILTVTAAPKGELKIDADWGVIATGKEVYGTVTFNVGGVAPPVPPTPIPPEPKPPTPPIPTAGFRVLIVYETSDLNKLPASQVSLLTAKAIKDYLDLRCVTGPDGTKEWRMWDKDVSTKNVSKIWQDAMALPRQSLPWIVISNGIAGYSGPLPTTVNDTLELLKKYGGV